jgi:nitrate/nitrite transporter NarK
MTASGWLGDRFGGKRVLLTAIAVFTAASALSWRWVFVAVGTAKTAAGPAATDLAAYHAAFLVAAALAAVAAPVASR